MNFEIRRLADFRFIFRVFSLWVFIQVLRDIITYSVLMFSQPLSIIWLVADGTDHRRTIACIFAVCAALIFPLFVLTLMGSQSPKTKGVGRLAVFALFAVGVMWMWLIPQAYRMDMGGAWLAASYSFNCLEALVLAAAFAWNINQYMKYELDYGLLVKVPKEYQTVY